MPRRDNLPPKTGLLAVFLVLTAFTALAQQPVFRFPTTGGLDSIYPSIYAAYGMDEEDVKRGQKFGWYKYSDKIDADQYYQDAKQYCIGRVGEVRFYEQFRFHSHSFKDDPSSEVFTISFRYYPFPGDSTSGNDYVNIVFQRFDFLNIHEMSWPSNLPDCRLDSLACAFPVNRQRAKEIGLREVVKDRDFQVVVRELTASFKWLCYARKNDWYSEKFTVDARTGEVGTVEKSHRID